jgi:putative ATP-dependent endonuclease of OLD family
MKITEIAIHNYRGITDTEIELKDYSLLVGPNNAGKSTVIDAIRAFYEKDRFTFKKDSDFPFVESGDSESWIEIEYALSEEEDESLASEYRNPKQSLRVRKYFKAEESKKTGCIFAYTRECLSESQFYGDKNVQQGKFGEVIYIPAVSRVDDHTKLSGPSALRDLLSSVLEEVVEESEAFEHLTTAFDSFASSIKTAQTKDSRSLQGLRYCQKLCSVKVEKGGVSCWC